MSNRLFHRLVLGGVVCTIAMAPGIAWSEGKLEIKGFTMLDMGYQSKSNDPDWYDVLRPTKLPSFENEYGEDGNFFASVRQSRLGLNGFIPTSNGKEIKTIFEFELFGTGSDAGQTTFRLRHAWGEYEQWGAGQTWSNFMDPDVFPNTIEYWGPNGMVFYRNVQLRYTPINGDNQLAFSLERPGASGDPGVNSGDPDIANLSGHFPLPDVTVKYRMNRDWGHIQAAGILRKIEWYDSTPTPVDLSGSDTGWGINLSSNIKFNQDTLRLSVVFGEGIQNYMNDASVDVGATGDSDVAEALGLLGLVAFYDHTWNSDWTSSVGFSYLDMDNSDAQAASAFKQGQYAVVNLLNHSVDNLMWGGELQYGKRKNNSDGFSSDDLRIQFSFKYSFGAVIGG